MSEYYQLLCEECKEEFKPLLATSPNELLYPDYEESEKEGGVLNTESLRRFHEHHRHHALTTRTA